MLNYWEEQNKQPSFEAWLDSWSGSIMCGCDHGCCDWLLKNAAKAYAIMEAQKEGQPKEFLDLIVQRHCDEVGREFYKKQLQLEKE